MIVYKGEVYLVDLGEDKRGSEQKKTRPCVILQNNVGNKYSPTTICALLTTKEKKTKDGKKYPMQVEIDRGDVLDGELEEDSLLLCEQIHTIDKERLLKRIGRIEDNTPLMDDINKALKVSFGIK